MQSSKGVRNAVNDNIPTHSSDAFETALDTAATGFVQEISGSVSHTALAHNILKLQDNIYTSGVL